MAEGESVHRTIRDVNGVAQALGWVAHVLEKTLPGGPVRIEMGRELRTPEQNNKLWPMLRDLSEQLRWYDMELSPEDWKHLITALVYGTRIVPGIDGGFVALGKSTKNMSKKMFSELIEAIYAFGSERQVAWSEPSLKAWAKYREAQQ